MVLAAYVHCGKLLPSYSCRRCQSARVPAWNWHGVPFPFEQFFASSKLRIVAIPNLEPRTSLRIVGRPPVFRDDTLKVQLASFLEEGNSSSFYVLSVNDG